MRTHHNLNTRMTDKSDYVVLFGISYTSSLAWFSDGPDRLWPAPSENQATSSCVFEKLFTVVIFNLDEVEVSKPFYLTCTLSIHIVILPRRPLSFFFWFPFLNLCFLSSWFCVWIRWGWGWCRTDTDFLITVILTGCTAHVNNNILLGVNTNKITTLKSQVATWSNQQASIQVRITMKGYMYVTYVVYVTYGMAFDYSIFMWGNTVCCSLQQKQGAFGSLLPLYWGERNG